MMRTISRNNPPERRLLRYVRTGHDAQRVVGHLLQRVGRNWGGVARLLDFACGRGRVTRHFANVLDPTRVWAADIDRPAVEFVAAAFGAQPIHSCSDPRQVDLGDEPFDVVFVGSLFTHLPRRTFGAWLEVLFRAVGPDGLLVFSAHGDAIHTGVPRDPSGFTFVPESETDRLPSDEYGTTFVSPAAMADLAAAAGIRSLHRMDRDLWTFHDVYVASPSARPGLVGHHQSPLRHGGFHAVRFPSPDHVQVVGFVVTPAVAPEVREVWLRVDGRDVARADLAAPERRRPDGGADREWVWRGFYVEGDAGWLDDGVHDLAAVALLADGSRDCFDVVALRR
jgi:SAM-dependent methyltransferase